MWYEEAIFYHIYPLGLTGAPKQNDYRQGERRLLKLMPWIDHIQELGFNALYIGPLFESVGHGYETTDYRKLDSRLGSNQDLKAFVKYCHEKGIKVIFDGVFNHTGRDFFAFRDIRENRENSRYLNWYQNVNLWGNNSYDDGFSYDTWGGYDLLTKLNLYEREVIDYHIETVRFWIEEFDIDGIRLDAADVLNFDFMKRLRYETDRMKEDFFLVGEVIHGQYNNWVNDSMLHSVTSYAMHKAFYSSHNDHNYFELAHTVKRDFEMCGRDAYHLYQFVDNHDVERIASKVSDRRNLYPVFVLLYTLPGIPSVYYGSEFAVEGKKEKYSDDSLRPCLDLEEMKEKEKFYPQLLKRLADIKKNEKALVYGDYEQLYLSTEVYCFRRGDVIVVSNNSDKVISFQLDRKGSYIDALNDEILSAGEGPLKISVQGHDAMILLPQSEGRQSYGPLQKPKIKIEEKQEKVPEIMIADKSYEDMSIDELQSAILAKMKANGPLNERMIKDVTENIYRDSLLNWVKSFR